MSAAYSVTVPYPPTVNRYYVNTGGQRKAKREEVDKYQRAVGLCVLQQGKAPALEGLLSCSLEVWPPDRRRRDLDNILKALLDAMQKAGVFADDQQIAHLCMRRMPMVGGMVKVQLSPLGATDAHTH